MIPLLLACACGDGGEPFAAGTGESLTGSVDCYGPQQNLDLAYEAGSEGCACDPAADEGLCLPDATGRLVALICDGGRWAAVNDGPCDTVRSANCYAPYQNLDGAYEPDAEGCDCADDEAVCLSDSTGRDVALVCEARRWIAVEDGPCGV